MAISAPEQTCITCDVVNEYVRLANAFTQDLSVDLLKPMWLIFGSMVGLWVVLEGIKLVVGHTDLKRIARDLIFIIVATGLMSGQGPRLVDSVYSASLTAMSGAASFILSVGTIGEKTKVSTAEAPADGVSGIAGLEGMERLVFVAENGVLEVFRMAGEIASEVGVSNFGLPIIYAILLALPYFLLLIVYFAQVVISIFRVMMVAALSPILMLGFGFEWGRGMTFTAMRSLFASFMVLYGCTVALAVCLYGVAAMNVADPALTGSVGEILAFDNPTLLVAIALGWLGTAFMAEATGMANSIAGSQLTNTAAGVITAGATATGLTLLRSTFNRKTPGRIGKTAMGLVDAARYGIGAAKDPGGAMNAAGRRLSDGAQKIADRLKVPQFDDTTPKLEDNKRDDS